MTTPTQQALRAWILFSVLTATAASSTAQTAPFTPVESAGTVVTSDFGELPREITWTDDQMPMVLVPGGTYRIGLPEDAPVEGISEREVPEVSVSVGSFYIDKTEVPVATYRAVADELGLGVPRSIANKDLLGPEKPVIGINYDDARQFAAHMRKALPTEAEWEIAARGTQAFLYPWGNEPRTDIVINKGAGGATADVGTTPADESPFGVLDMAGNVAEWTSDPYQRDYYSRVAGKEFPRITERSDTYTIRGGNYFDAGDGRVTTRGPAIPISTSDEIGFRTVFRLRKPPKATPTPTPLPPTPTPTPGAEARLGEVKARLAKHMRGSGSMIPTDLAGFSNEQVSIPVVNMSPHEVTVAIVDLDAGPKVYNFPRMLPPAATAALPIPQDRIIHLLGWADTGYLEEPVLLTAVNSMSDPLIVVQPNAFSPFVKDTGEALVLDTEEVAEQVYPGMYYPQWDEFSVTNRATLPIEVVAGPQGEEGGIDDGVTVTLEPGESVMFTELPTGDLRLGARYVGAAAEFTSDLVGFRSDASAAFRSFTIEEMEGGETVQVMTMRKPRLMISRRDVMLPPEIRGKFVPAQ